MNAVNLEATARRVADIFGDKRVPGMKFTCGDRFWRVTHPDNQPPIPGEWVPVLDDAATVGAMLDALDALTFSRGDTMKVERIPQWEPTPAGMRLIRYAWAVSAPCHGGRICVEHELLGVAVAQTVVRVVNATRAYGGAS